MNPKVDFYFEKERPWQKEVQLLRTIVLECGLEEVLKWGCPCYAYEGTNVVLIHDFKNYCALLFFKGVLLRDTEQVLIQQTEHVQSARQIRFTSMKEISSQKAIIKAYIYEAIEVEKAGLKVKLKKPAELKMADELKLKLDKNSKLKKAFESLTPGRQRAYLIYFSAAKQSKTREARIEKCIPAILAGKGPNE